jgi:hypothetical protein
MESDQFILAAIAILSAIASLVGAFIATRAAEKVANSGCTGQVKKRPRKNGQHPDWYKPIQF